MILLKSILKRISANQLALPQIIVRHKKNEMAQSRFEYVRTYEDATNQHLVPSCYIVVRIDGKNFHRFSKRHNFMKPNDKRALDLMNAAARWVMNDFNPLILMAYGQSDEYSFLIGKKTNIFNRRSNKISSCIVSSFTSAYVLKWPTYFPNEPLQYPPSFDSRCVIYPDLDTTIDYFKWRQVDCHINNLFNTTYHALTGEYTRYELLSEIGQQSQGGDICDSDYYGGDPPSNFKTTPFKDHIQELLAKERIKTEPKILTPGETDARLKGTVSGDKNEILWADYGINYNNELQQFRKGSLLVLYPETIASTNKKKLNKNLRKKEMEDAPPAKIGLYHTDIIKDDFWEENKSLFV